MCVTEIKNGQITNILSEPIRLYWSPTEIYFGPISVCFVHDHLRFDNLIQFVGDMALIHKGHQLNEVDINKFI